MTSWQTRAVSLYLRATRKNPVVVRRARANPLARTGAAAPRPRRLRDRVDVEWVAGFTVVRVRPPGQVASAQVTGGMALAGSARTAVPVPAGAASTGAAATTSPGALLYFHGGSFRSAIARQHWDLIGALSDTTGRDVFVPRYGLLPDHTADDALAFLDALQDHLRPMGPLHILGDSAGGNLAMLWAQSWARGAAGARGGLGSGAGPEIVGVTLVAPWLDLSISNPRVPEVARVDPWLDPESIRPLGVAWAAGRGPHDAAVSPLFGDLGGLPPTAVLVGTRDICLPDCEQLAARSPAVRLHVEVGSPHVYPLLPTPEGRAGRAAIIRFVEETFAGR